MAWTWSLVTQGSDNSAGTTATTASITTAAGELYVIDVWTDNASGGSAAPPTGISGAGLTFALVDDIPGDASFLNLSRWRAEATGANSGTLTITSAASKAETLWIVTKETVEHATGSNGANAFNSNKSEVGNAGAGSTHSTTISALASSSNGCLCSFAYEYSTFNTVLTATPGNSFVELGDVGTLDSGNIYSEGLCTMFLANATNPSVTWSNTATNRSALAHELVATGGGGGGGGGSAVIVNVMGL